MSDRIPLGDKEGLRLEFKGADALKEPENIAREVVAMLNADGGKVWVGLREEEGRAVAVEPIADPEREERRLWDFLVDVIEPPLRAREVKVDVRESKERKRLLCITATPLRDRRPYAFLKKGGRHYVVRIGDRIRPMAREEIIPQAASDNPEIGLAESKVLTKRKAALESDSELFWLCFEPGIKVTLDIQDHRFDEFLQDPSATGNRSAGWNFSQFSYKPQIRQDKLVTDPGEDQKVEIRRDGELILSAPLDSLILKGEENEIWPPILLEYVISAFRVASAVYRDTLEPSDPVLVDFLLIGVKGWKIRAGSPEPYLSRHRLKMFTHATDLVLAQPLTFRYGEIGETPDRCGYRLIERVYEAFGIRREGIPNLFDPQTGRLVFPE